jgi:hypothetical protein
MAGAGAAGVAGASVAAGAAVVVGSAVVGAPSIVVAGIVVVVACVVGAAVGSRVAGGCLADAASAAALPQAPSPASETTASAIRVCFFIGCGPPAAVAPGRFDHRSGVQ